MAEPNIHDLARQVAVLEERMNTQTADLGKALAEFRADMARRDRDNTRWIIALVAGAVIITVGLLRYLP